MTYKITMRIVGTTLVVYSNHKPRKLRKAKR